MNIKIMKKLSFTKNSTTNQNGFTIIELMIATAVFAVIMLIAATTVIYVSKTYVKGQVESETQQTARSVLATITQDIRFNPASSVTIPSGQTSNPFFFCIGNQVYVYSLNTELSTQTGSMYSPHDLVVYASSTCPNTTTLRPTFGANGIVSGGITVAPYSGSTQELLSTHERLGELNIKCAITTGSGCSTYTVSLIVAYGDSDLLNDASAPAPDLSSEQYSYICANETFGGNFCSVSPLTTTVESRIN
jgi:prepilin-type N-terminal cleavage/methylation domain-containing protein